MSMKERYDMENKDKVSFNEETFFKSLYRLIRKHFNLKKTKELFSIIKEAFSFVKSDEFDKEMEMMKEIFKDTEHKKKSRN